MDVMCAVGLQGNLFFPRKIEGFFAVRQGIVFMNKTTVNRFIQRPQHLRR